MIELKNVLYKYKNGTIVLDNIDFKIDDGEFISIIGKNGSRKIHSGQTYIWNFKTDKRRYFYKRYKY